MMIIDISRNMLRYLIFRIIFKDQMKIPIIIERSQERNQGISLPDSILSYKVSLKYIISNIKSEENMNILDEIYKHLIYANIV